MSYHRITHQTHYYDDKAGINLHHDVEDESHHFLRHVEINLSWRTLTAIVRRHEKLRKPIPKRRYGTAKEMEIIVAHYFGIRGHVIVPNVSWGMLLYEADLLVLHPSGYVDEVEIKVTKSDLKRDARKYHCHDSKAIRRLWFAVPERLKEAAIQYAPERAGILYVSENTGFAAYARSPQINKSAERLTDVQQFQLARLGAMRIWKLKRLLETNHVSQLEPRDGTGNDE